MSVTVEKLEKNMAKLTIEVSADELEKAIQAAYLKQKNRINIPGFRKGKAPRAMIEKMYGAGIFYEDAANALIPNAYSEALAECEETIVSQPSIDVVQLEKGKPFIFTAEVALKPEVTLGEYKGLEVPKSELEVTEEEVAGELRKEQESNSRTIDVDDRAVADGDKVTLDFEGFVDGEAFDGGKGTDYPLTIGSGAFIPGFEEQLVGAEIGKETEVNVTFPENYQAENLAGKPAVFKCTVKKIEVKELPELDDEFAKDVSEYDTLEELKTATRERLEKYAKAGAETQMQDAALGKVVEANEIEVPSIMVEDEMDRMTQELDQQLRYQGLSVGQYLEFVGKDLAGFREELKPDALRQVKTRMILNGIAEAEKIEVSDDEVEEELKVMAVQYDTSADKIKEMIGAENLTYLQKDLKVKKAIQFIYDNAVIK